jgi:hypothetical protein
LVASIAWTSGCGGGSSSSPSGAGSCSGGSLSTVPLNQLTAAQTTTVCDDVQACSSSLTASIVGPLVEVLCRTTGAAVAQTSGAQTDDQLRQACQQIYDACIQDADGGAAQSADAGAASAARCGASLSVGAAGCNQTVGQLVTCVNDSTAATVNALNASLQAIPACSALTLANAGAAVDAGSVLTTNVTSMVASCQALGATCPGLVGGDGGIQVGP